MKAAPNVALPSARRSPIWEREVGWILLLVGGLYLLPLFALTVRGEEPRWAHVARSMISSGDWIVPRFQESLFFSRPPLHAWCIAAIGLAVGEVKVLAIRLPSVLAVLATTLVLYWYVRQSMSRIGALAASVAFATMGLVLEIGRLGETDLMFTALVSASLLLWHGMYERRGRADLAVWTVAYALVGLGMLTKGFQAPVYFAAAVGGYLLWSRNLRALFTWQHLAGIAVFCGVFAAWQVPYLLSEGWQATRQMYWHDVAMRFDDKTWLDWLLHLGEYPVEVLVCMLPWSPLLLAFAQRSFRRSLGSSRNYVVFAAICLMVAFPSCWLVSGAKGRYFLPLFPCVAVLVGAVVDRLAQSSADGAWRRHWSYFVHGLSLVMLTALPLMAVASLLAGDATWAMPWYLAVPMMGVGVGCAAMTYGARLAATPEQLRRGVLAIGGFVGVAYCGVVLNALVQASPDTARQVAELKSQLPADADVVSYGTLSPMFMYYFDELVPRRSEQVDVLVHDDARYFCLSHPWGSPPPESLPFRWQRVAEVCCDRTRSPHPEHVVIVGRRLFADDEPARLATPPPNTHPR